MKTTYLVLNGWGRYADIEAVCSTPRSAFKTANLILFGDYCGRGKVPTVKEVNKKVWSERAGFASFGSWVLVVTLDQFREKWKAITIKTIKEKIGERTLPCLGG